MPPARAGALRAYLGGATLLLAVALTSCTDAAREAASPIAAWSPDEAGTLEFQIEQQYRQALAHLDQMIAQEAPDRQLSAAVGELAMLHQVYQNHDRAIEAYRVAASLDRTELRWHYYEALLLRREGDLEGARSELEAVLEIDPGHEQSLLRLAEICIELTDLKCAADRLADLDSDSARLLAVRAELEAARQNFVGAVELFSQAAELQPDNQRIRIGLGRALQASGERSRAAVLLREAQPSNAQDYEIDLVDPLLAELGRRNIGSQQLWTNGRALLLAGRAEAAEEQIRQALMIVPHSAPMRIDLGAVLVAQGRLEEAEEQYLQVLAQQPDYLPGLVQRSRLRALMGDRDAAIEILEQAVALDPSHSSLYTDLGNLYRVEESFGEAIRCYRRAIELDPRSRSAYIWLGWLQQVGGDSRTAHATFKTALANIPLDPWLESLELRLRSDVVDPNDVSTALEEARRLLQGNPSVFNAETFAMLHQSRGDRGAALQWQLAALEAARRAGLDSAEIEDRLRRYEAGRGPRNLLVRADIDASRVPLHDRDLQRLQE